MRIIAFSDIHGLASSAAKLFAQTCKTTDLYIFCGDGVRDVEQLAAEHPDKRFVMVRGNCDYNSALSDVQICEAGGVKIGAVHGHLHGVGWDLSGLQQLAYENKLGLVLYGHTHRRECLYKDGVYYVNPGSLVIPRDGLGPSYAAIDIIPAGILVSHADFER